MVPPLVCLPLAPTEAAPAREWLEMQVDLSRSCPPAPEEACKGGEVDLAWPRLAQRRASGLPGSWG